MMLLKLCVQHDFSFFPPQVRVIIFVLNKNNNYRQNLHALLHLQHLCYSGYSVVVVSQVSEYQAAAAATSPASRGRAGRGLSRGVSEVIDVRNSSAAGAPQIENPAALKKTRSF